MPDKKSRYDEILERQAQLDELSIKNQNEKDAAVRSFREKQSKLNVERAQLDRELKKEIASDPVRAAKHQTAGK